MKKLEEGKGSSGTGVSDSCEVQCGWWEYKLDPLQEQQVLSSAKTFLQTLFCVLFIVFLLGATWEESKRQE